MKSKHEKSDKLREKNLSTKIYFVKLLTRIARVNPLHKKVVD